jgi:hypothetical protein
MPNIKDSDLCTWCDQTYGAHFGIQCPSPFEKHCFVQQGTISLRPFPHGTKVEYTDQIFNLIIGTIICVHPASVLMGWTAQDNIPSYAHTAVHHKLIQPPYTHGYTVSRELLVKRVISTTATPTLVAQQHIQSAGLTCSSRFCKTFVPMAEANQPDGSFVCYNCRQRPACMR